ncbi:hypothetical protein Desti_4140 [Desulfomonile tiedjei DSM 6799]|uniref:Uncharacterized protein n=2 Tax=Desulfomonile tiedjei TaxID=2358 RepID=I4CB36_DESTA|nr:hypothetical protein Desti_4140 [Desulfomonile tiedjei DSM 6799]
MDYELKIVRETDPAWNESMDSWWNNGGALLWNRYGGFGKDSLVLSAEELESFLERARTIQGWNSSPLPDAETNPVIIVSFVKSSQPEAAREAIPPDSHALPGSFESCCSDCGRPIHEALREMASRDSVTVSVRAMNHLLNSLAEAIAFSRQKGPNNYRTWEASMEEITADIQCRS